MKAISFDRVTKSFKSGRPRGLKDRLLGSKGTRPQSQRVTVLREVSFSVAPGESVAILGHNGAGKSTILKLLAGTLQPSSGVVSSSGRIAPLLELGAGFHPDLTGRENILLSGAFMGVSRRDIRAKLDAIIDFSGIAGDIDSPVRFYSSGMYARLGFSVAVHLDPDILLIDEVLAVGDPEFQKQCLGRMGELQSEGKTMLLVTHSLEQAASFAPRAMALRRGEIVFDGDIDEMGTIDLSR